MIPDGYQIRVSSKSPALCWIHKNDYPEFDKLKPLILKDIFLKHKIIDSKVSKACGL